MIIFTARVRALAGKEAEAETALKAMVASVKDKEPGAFAYACHRVADTPGEYLFYEIYADQAICDAHMVTPHFEAFKSQFAVTLDPAFGAKIENLDLVSGFYRVQG